LVVSGVTFSPVFDSSVFAYTASVANSVASVTVTPTTSSAGATVTVDGVAVISGSTSLPIALNVGVNVIEIKVTASDPRNVETYTVTITRAAPTPSGGGSATGGGSIPSTNPVTPPADVISRDVPGAVLVNGVEMPVSLVRNSSSTGWIVSDDSFRLSVLMENGSGTPEPLAADGELQTVQGGRIVVGGSGYAPDTMVDVFMIPVSSLAVSKRFAARALLTDTFYLGQALTGETGEISNTFFLPQGVAPGQYVLQINGISPLNQMVSVNMAALVMQAPKAPTMRAGFVQRAAFYDERSSTISVDGEKKLRQMVRALPKNATAVQVEIVGVSVSLDSLSENLALAQKRAEGVAKYLTGKGIKGSYTVTVTATFTTDGAERSLRSGPNALAGTNGKPLTTATINYLTPEVG